LRPFFLSPQDEKRVRPVVETIADLAERVTAAALADKNLFAQFHLRPEEARLSVCPPVMEEPARRHASMPFYFRSR